MAFFQSNREKKVLIPTMLFAVAGFLGIDIHLASLPAIMEFLHTTKPQMQQSISIYLLGMGGSMLFYGPIADKYGRKPIILIGLILAAMASFWCMFVHTIHAFLLSRLLQGVGAGVCLGLGRTVIGDVLQGNRFAVVAAWLSSFGALAPFLAPILGGYLQTLIGWQANFFAFGLYLLISACAYGIFSPETLPFKQPHAFHPKALFHHYREILKHRVFVSSMMLAGLSASIGMVYAALNPFILQVQFHLTPVVYGWVVSSVTVGAIVSRFFAAPMIHKWGRGTYLQIFVFLFCLISVVFLIFGLSNFLSLTGFIVFSCLTIMTRTSVAAIFSSYAMEIFPLKRGTAGSLYGSAQMLISFIISGVVSLFSTDGIYVLVISYVFIGLLMMFFVQQLLKGRKVSRG